MIDKVEFKNYKVLRDSTLPLGRVTVLIGANGSGKSAALDAVASMPKGETGRLAQGLSLGAGPGDEFLIRLSGRWCQHDFSWGLEGKVSPEGSPQLRNEWRLDGKSGQPLPADLNDWLQRSMIFDLNPAAIARPVTIQPNQALDRDGGGLAGVLDRIHSEHHDRFLALKQEVGAVFVEFDDIGLRVEAAGTKTFSLRRATDKRHVAARDLSDGTLLALAILTLSHLPDPPAFVGLEEPDRGIHPRLLDHLQDAVYHLAYPENFGEQRDPVQVVVTTHSPYLLNLFREEPEEVVIAKRVGDNVQFTRLSDTLEIVGDLGEASLGEVWYTGALGGVPVRT